MKCFGLAWILFTVVYSIHDDINLSISPPTSGFFIRKLAFDDVKNSIRDNVIQKKFQIIDPLSKVRLHGRLGPLSFEEMVDKSAASNITRFLQPSVHFVTYSVHQKDPIVRFLAHLNLKKLPDLFGRYCFHVIVNYGEGKHSMTGCHVDIDGKDESHACYAAARLNWPSAEDFKGGEGLVQISARFFVQRVYSRICNPLYETQINAVNNKANGMMAEHWFSVPGKALMQNSQELQDFPLDRDILLRFSDDRLKAGDVFRVDVWLESYSQLSRFKLRADSGQDGLGFIRVIPHDESWTVHYKSVHQMARNLSIDCRIKDEFLHLTFQSRRRLFSVEARILEVSSANRSANVGANQRSSQEIVWTLSPAAERGNRANRRMTLRGRTKTVHRLDQGLRGLVPVIKRNHLFNLACLTGNVQYEPLYVFALNRLYHPLDVTAQATCYITNSRIIDVDLGCRSLIFKCQELPPPTNVFNVTLLVKYRSEVIKYQLLRVYYPKLTVLSIDNNVLHVIKGWRIPQQDIKSNNNTKIEFSKRQKRQLRKWLPDSPATESEVFDNRGNESFICQRNFQQTQARILARFSGGCEEDHACWMPSQNDDWYDVTQLAVSRIQVSRKGVVHIAQDGTIRGLSGGSVKLSLAAPNDVLLCSASLSVQTRPRVKVQSVSTQLISSMKNSVTFESSTHDGNLYIELDSEVRRGQTAFLYSHINFAPGVRRTALWHLSSNSYFLRVTSLQPAVRVLSSTQPQILVITSDYERHLGEEVSSTMDLVSLQVFAPLGCARNRRSQTQTARPLLPKSVVSARIFMSDNAGESRQLPADQRTGAGAGSRMIPSLLGPLQMGSGTGTGGLFAPGGVASDALDDPAHTRPLSALQIGMYVLLAIFCLAIVIFALNCFVMVSRHRRQHAQRRSMRPLSEPHLKRSASSQEKKRRSILSSSGATERTLADGIVEEYADANWVWMDTEQLRLRGGNCAERLLCPEADQISQAHTSTFQRRAAATDRSRPLSTGLQTTYEGQECSIRILLNPFDQTDQDAVPAAATAALKPIAEKKQVDKLYYSPHHLYYNHKLDIRKDHQNLLEMQQLPPAPPVRTTSRQFVAMAAASTGTHNSAVSGMEWDYDVMQMSYDQLMSYFDNMRESVA